MKVEWSCAAQLSRAADPERLRLPLQLAPDFVLDGLWQGFCVPTLGYVDRHTLRVQHVAMIVLLRGKVLGGLRGRLFRRRSGPGDELVADHLLRQLLRRAAVRRDDPAAPLSPRLFPPGHHSLQSSGPYARCHCGRTRRPAFLAALGGAKMERVSEDLQLSVIVEGRRPLALEPQPLEKLDFLRGHRAAERRILKEFLEPGLFADRLFDFPLDKLESLRLPWDDAVV